MRPAFVLAMLQCVFLASITLAGSAEVPVAADAIQPHLAIDRDGTIYLVCLHRGNISVAVSRDRGKSFSAPVVAIDVQGRQRGGKQRGPRIGVDDNKVVHVTAPVVLDNSEFGRKYPVSDLVYVQSRDGGKTWSTPVRINEVAKKAPEALHWMAVSRAGLVHVSWLDIRDRNGPGQDLFYAKISDGKVSPNVAVAHTVCTCCAPGLALDASGNPALAYREGEDKDSREILLLRSSDGGQTFSKPVRINQEPTNEFACPMSAPAVALSPDGKNFAAAWKVRRSGKSSSQVYWVLGTPSTLSKDALVHGQLAKHDHPSLVFDDAGAVWCAWEDTRHGTQQVFARRSTKDGDFPVSEAREGAAGFPALAANAGLVAIAYESSTAKGSSVRFRLLLAK